MAVREVRGFDLSAQAAMADALSLFIAQAVRDGPSVARRDRRHHRVMLTAARRLRLAVVEGRLFLATPTVSQLLLCALEVAEAEALRAGSVDADKLRLWRGMAASFRESFAHAVAVDAAQSGAVH